MDSNDPEVIVDQVSDLSSTKETVLFLGFFCSSRLTFLLNWELWMILFSAETILASSSSKFGIEYTASITKILIIHWINQLHFFDPLHRFRRKLWTSTYLGLEPYLPTSKRRWCMELLKVKIRNVQSLLNCTIILRRVSSTEDDWIFGWQSRLAFQISILSWPFTFLHCGRVERLFDRWIPLKQFLRIRCWWRRTRSCKNVSRYTMCPEYLAALLCGSAWWKNVATSLQVLDEALVDWQRGHFHCELIQHPEILRIVHTIYFILQFLYSAGKFLQDSFLILDEFSSRDRTDGRTLEFP